MNAVPYQTYVGVATVKGFADQVKLSQNQL